MIGADDVRRVAAGLPGASERMSYGMPGFRVADRLFARIRDEGDVLLVWSAGLEEKQELIAAGRPSSSPRRTMTAIRRYSSGSARSRSRRARGY